MGQHPQRYIHNVAKSVVGQVRLCYGGAPELDSWESDDPNFPNVLWQRYGVAIMGVLEKMGPAARGKIAACGVGHGSPTTGSLCHWEVNHGQDLNASYSGDQLLTLLATYVVIAAIVDIIRAEVQKMRDEEREAWEEIDCRSDVA